MIKTSSELQKFGSLKIGFVVINCSKIVVKTEAFEANRTFECEESFDVFQLLHFMLTDF